MIKLARCILPTVGLLIGLGACGLPPEVSPEQAALNAKLPGLTGRTFVIGSNSTIAGDAEATYLQQKWGVGRQR